MEFTPQSDEEIQKELLPPEGFYKGVVTDASTKFSQTGGNEYIGLIITAKNVHEAESRDYKFWDNLMWLGSMKFKYKHFCENTGLSAQFNLGRVLPNDCWKKEVHFEVVHTVNKKSGQLQATVKDYITAPASSSVATNPELNDDITF